jgi:kynurenine aminotransferase
LIGEPHLIKYAAAANTRVVFSCVSPLQEAVAVAFEKAESHGYYEKTVKAYQERMKTLNKVWDELGLPVYPSTYQSNNSTRFLKAGTL